MNTVELVLVVVAAVAIGSAVAAAWLTYSHPRPDAADPASGLAAVARDTVVRLLADPVVVVAADGTLADVNAAGERLLARLPEDTDAAVLVDAPTELQLDGRVMRVDLVVTPVRQGERLLGHVVVATSVSPVRRRHQELTDAHQDLLREMAETERRRADLEHLAVRDSLTGLIRRRDLPRALQVLCDDPLADFALLVIDIDRFDLVNDAHGRDVGDQLLAGIGRALRETTRADDTVVRYGGEEFVVIMRSVDRSVVLNRAEQLRTACSSVVVDAGRNPVSVTVSIGAALSGDVYRTPPAMQRAADRALWTAKRSGRDRVVLYQPDDVALGAGAEPLSQRFGTGSRGRVG